MHSNKHTEVYDSFFGTSPGNRVCELTGKSPADVTHIHAAGMSADISKHRISNLMALCREAHLYFGDKKEYYEFLTIAHQDYILNKIPHVHLEDHADAFTAFCIETYGSINFNK